MGLGPTPKDRERLQLVPASKTMFHGTKTAVHIVFDACAEGRGKTGGAGFSLSPNQAASSMLKKAMSGFDPKKQSLYLAAYFDVTVGDPNMTPFRADVAQKRGERSPVTTVDHEIVLTFFNKPRLAALIDVDPHTQALLGSSDIPWTAMFKTREGKTLAWRLLAAGLRNIMLSMHARGEGSALTIRECDGKTIHTITLRGKYTLSEGDPALVHGEADLQIWQRGLELHEAVKHVLLMTIDTDIFLSAVAASADFDKRVPFGIRLGTGKRMNDYNVHELRAAYGAAPEKRLVNAFFLACLSTDYTESVTKLGYKTANVLELFATSDAMKSPFFEVDPENGRITFVLAKAVAAFKTFKPAASKYNDIEFKGLLMKIMYVVAYYGLYWDVATQPHGPELPPDADAPEVKVFTHVFLKGDDEEEEEEEQAVGEADGACTGGGSAMDTV